MHQHIEHLIKRGVLEDEYSIKLSDMLMQDYPELFPDGFMMTYPMHCIYNEIFQVKTLELKCTMCTESLDEYVKLGMADGIKGVFAVLACEIAAEIRRHKQNLMMEGYTLRPCIPVRVKRGGSIHYPRYVMTFYYGQTITDKPYSF